MKMIMRILGVLLGIGLILFFNFYIRTHNMGIFNPKGVIALAERNLMVTAVCLMMIVIIPVFVMLFSFAWRYREGNTKAKYTPDWHTNTALELTWWAIPAVIILILGTITWKSTHDLDPYKPLESTVKPITIQVVALDWKWLFIYPDEHIATVNYIELPKDVPVEFKITADAPMNAFWIPQLGGQVYAMPGMTAQLHLLASEVGDYKGLSSNFSGDGFSGMKFVAHVATESDYNAWLGTVRASPEVLTADAYTALAKQSKDNPVTYFASVEEGLYNKIIMKFMPPSSSGSMEEMPGMEGMDAN
jgi:cytochrome o ubiquinol oxidase subunit 2